MNVITQMFELDWIKYTQLWNFTIVDAAVTQTCGQGCWKWYGRVKFNEHYYHWNFDIYYN